MNAVFEMFIGHMALVSWFNFMWEKASSQRLVDPKNPVERRAAVRTEAASKF